MISLLRALTLSLTDVSFSLNFVSSLSSETVLLILSTSVSSFSTAPFWAILFRPAFNSAESSFRPVSTSFKPFLRFSAVFAISSPAPSTESVNAFRSFSRPSTVSFRLFMLMSTHFSRWFKDHLAFSSADSSANFLSSSFISLERLSSSFFRFSILLSTTSCFVAFVIFFHKNWSLAERFPTLFSRVSTSCPRLFNSSSVLPRREL